MKRISSLEEFEGICSQATEFQTHQFVVTVGLDRLPKPLRFAFSTAVELIRKYGLPCDVSVHDLPGDQLALHGWRRDGTCVIVLSNHLTSHGDKTSVHRSIIHELSHHLAGRGHGHDETWRRIFSNFLTQEGYPPGKKGQGRGNMA